jgi:hypothetical protein
MSARTVSGCCHPPRTLQRLHGTGRGRGNSGPGGRGQGAAHRRVPSIEDDAALRGEAEVIEEQAAGPTLIKIGRRLLEQGIHHEVHLQLLQVEVLDVLFKRHGAPSLPPGGMGGGGMVVGGRRKAVCEL